MVTAREVVEAVADPELPALTLADLGILRDVEEDERGRVTVIITPTYTGCPAMDTMRDDVEHALAGAGYRHIEVRKVLQPPWTTDWITAKGRRKLAAAGLAPPGPARHPGPGPVPLVLGARPQPVRCPRCGSVDTTETSRFGATACKALWRCRSCAEPFEHIKEL
ncbi:MAG: phenylacetate-CoA oxygenase subunit PaaJ [Actinomycetota bacterium]|nr:phenylacetate-CoA oxygenase subunit PaaJ [Actinomycetota bacterium]